MSSGLQTRVESMLLEADRLALRVLAPAARKMIVVLRSLAKGEKSVDDMLAECMLLYPGCKNLGPTLAFLEKLGVVERRGGDRYALTEFGKSVADALFDIIRDVRSLLENALKGSLNPVDLYVQLVTPAMSMVEIAMDTRSKSELMLALVTHAYISTLMASALSVLARSDPRFRSALELIERMILGETGGEE